MKTMCAWKNNRFSSLWYLEILFFAIHIFHYMPLNAMRTIGYQSYKKTYQQAKTSLHKIESVQIKRDLLIFLDDSEKDKLGAIGHDLITALYQEVSPIIVSSSLMCTLLECRDKNKQSIEALLSELANVDWLPERYGQNWQEIIKAKENIAVCKICFQPKQWIIKVINNSLLLLIPKSYCESLGIDNQAVKEYHKDMNTLSDIELQLGLKVNHMKTIEHTALRRSHLKEYFLPHYFADYFINSLDATFCTIFDYHNRKEIALPEWIIYIVGHGNINDSITSLSINQFKKLLYFMENKIKVQLLVVASCYVAGTNAKSVYGEIKNGTQQPNSFPIIIQGLNDVATLSNSPTCDMANWNLEQKISLRTTKSFGEFFKQAHMQETHYREIIKQLHDRSIANEPQIKMPGLEWFSVMDIDNKIVSIGAILAKTRDPQKTLDVASFFKKKPKIILLYTDNLPFELKIDLNSLKAIVSMVSSKIVKGNLVRIIHRIKKISAEGEPLIDVLKLFRLLVYANDQKWFFIDEISGSDICKDVLVYGGDKDSINAYFKDKDDVLYKLNFDFNNWQTKINPVLSGSYDDRNYHERLDIVRNKYPEVSAHMSLENQEITAEHIKDMEDMLKRKRQEQKD